jgi:hypothetical protein
MAQFVLIPNEDIRHISTKWLRSYFFQKKPGPDEDRGFEEKKKLFFAD